MTSSTHRWRFFRAGGFDQVRLDTGADLAHLAELDQKLWVALSCPTQGVELDAATLALVDSDADGHVRAPELIAAIDWAIARLRSPDVLIRAGALALADIRDDSDDNQRLLAATRRILASLGKADATHISVDDCTDIGRIFGGMPFNGDGVISAKGLSEDLQAAIATLIDRLGPVADRGGEPGVNRATLERFFEEGAALQAWRQDARAAVSGLPEGASALDAFAALQAVREKVDDFFQRCHLAAFDPRAANLLNGSEDDLKRIGSQLLSGGAGSQDVATLPLAYVRSGASLPLNDRLNPAWTGAMQAFAAQVVQPLLGERSELSEAEWRACREAVLSALGEPGQGAGDTWVVASGGLPPGVSDACCADLAREVRARGARFVVDTNGPALAQALSAGVDVFKPSLRELRQLTGQALSDEASQVAAARALIDAGRAGVVALSLGEQGAILVTAEGAWRAGALNVPVASTIGAGDSFVAGLVFGLAQGQAPQQAFAQALATSAAALLSQGTSLADPADVARLLPEVVVKAI